MSFLTESKKQAYLQGCYFKGKSYKEPCDMFERMDIAEQVYKGVTPLKTTTRADVNRGSNGRKGNGLESASPTNIDKVPTENHKGGKSHPRYFPTWEKNSCCMASDTPLRSVNYTRNTPKSMSIIVPTKKPALAANKSVVSLSSSTAKHRSQTEWYTMV